MARRGKTPKSGKDRDYELVEAAPEDLFSPDPPAPKTDSAGPWGEAPRGAPRHECGTHMNLAIAGLRPVLVCRTCYDKFPERTKPPLHCPVCGNLLRMQPWPRVDHYCVKCQNWFVAVPMDEKRQEEGTLQVYRELSDDDVSRWEEQKLRRYTRWNQAGR